MEKPDRVLSEQIFLLAPVPGVKREMVATRHVVVPNPVFGCRGSGSSKGVKNGVKESTSATKFKTAMEENERNVHNLRRSSRGDTRLLTPPYSFHSSSIMEYSIS